MGNTVAAVVLTGGRSRRMGRDKALLTLPDGRKCLQVVLEAAHAVASPVFLAVDTEDHATRLCAALQHPLPRVVLDTIPGAGPLAAISAALRAAAPADIVALAVDAPFVRPRLLEILCQSIQDSAARLPDAVAVRVNGVSQPLPALYTARLADLADQLLRDGRAGPRALLEAPEVFVRWLDMAVVQAADPDLRSFAEANTPEQWQALWGLY